MQKFLKISQGHDDTPITHRLINISEIETVNFVVRHDEIDILIILKSGHQFVESLGDDLEYARARFKEIESIINPED